MLLLLLLVFYLTCSSFYDNLILIMGLIRLEKKWNKFFFSKKNFIVLILVCLSLIFLYYIVNGLINSNYDGMILIDKNNDDLTLTIDNQMPLSDKAGMTLKVSDLDKGIIDEVGFSITAVGNAKYDIYLTSDDTDLKYVKIYLTDDTGIPLNGYEKKSVPMYSELKVLNDLPEGLWLYSGKLENKSTQKFNLRIWLGDLYPKTINKNSFSVKINVRTVL